MSSFLGDVRFAMRNLVQRPGFTAVVVVTLALGLGVNTAIFSVVETLIRSLPFPDADRLVSIRETRSNEDFNLFQASYPNYRDWRERMHAVALGGYGRDGRILKTETGAELVMVGIATRAWRSWPCRRWRR